MTPFPMFPFLCLLLCLYFPCIKTEGSLYVIRAFTAEILKVNPNDGTYTDWYTVPTTMLPMTFERNSGQFVVGTYQGCPLLVKFVDVINKVERNFNFTGPTDNYCTFTFCSSYANMVWFGVANSTESSVIVYSVETTTWKVTRLGEIVLQDNFKFINYPSTVYIPGRNSFVTEVWQYPNGTNYFRPWHIEISAVDLKILSMVNLTASFIGVWLYNETFDKNIICSSVMTSTEVTRPGVVSRFNISTGNYFNTKYFECNTGAWDGGNLDIDYINYTLYVMDLCPNLELYIVDLKTNATQSYSIPLPPDQQQIFALFYYDPDAPHPPPIIPTPPPTPPPTPTPIIPTTPSCGSSKCVHGTCQYDQCDCYPGWTGQECNETTCIQCWKGVCHNSTCECFEGWIGTYCDEIILTPDDKKQINYVSASVTSSIWFLIIFLKLFFGHVARDFSHTFLAIVTTVQMMLVPITTNVYIRKTIDQVYQPILNGFFFGPFEFGFYGFDGFLSTLGGFFIIISVLLILNKCTSFKGIKYCCGSIIIIDGGFILMFALMMFIPLLSKLLRPAIYFYIERNDVLFGYIYTGGIALLMFLLLGLLYRCWLKAIFNNFRNTYGTPASGWYHFCKCGSKYKKKLRDTRCVCCVPLFSTKENSCCCDTEQYNITDDDHKHFISRYGPLVETYGIYDHNAIFVRRLFSHRFVLVKLISDCAFVFLSILTWNVIYSFLILASFEAFFLILVMIIMPYKQRRSFLQQALSSIILITQLILMYLFIYFPSFELLLALSLIPIILAGITIIFIPIFGDIVNGGEDDIKKQLIQKDDSSTSFLTKKSE